MTNKDLGDFISIDNYSKASKELLQKTEEIIGVGADMATTLFLGIPVFSILKPFLQDLRNWKSRVELKQLAYFFKEFENLDQYERSEFSYMIQENEEDFTERLFYYITQLNDKKKATLCGKIGVSYARKKIDGNQFFKLIQIVQNASYNDLIEFKQRILNYEMGGEGRSDRFIKPIERFTSSSIFSSIFKKSDVHLVWSLINLALAIQEIDFKGITDISFAKAHGKLSVDKIANSLKAIKEKRRLTSDAYYLYHFGLAFLD